MYSRTPSVSILPNYKVKAAFQMLLRTERSKSGRLKTELQKLQEEAITLNDEMATLRDEIDELKEKLTALENEGMKKSTGSGGPEKETQTSLTGCAGPEGGQGFYLLEYPALMTELALEQEMEDLNGCALASWEGVLEKIKNSRRPPAGVGSGFVSSRLFRRLFLGCVHRSYVFSPHTTQLWSPIFHVLLPMCVGRKSRTYLC